VPVPHVESLLTFDYDVSGRFSDAYIAGSAAFADSRFLGARLGAGATGTIDTSAAPIRYGGEGDLSDLDVNHLGAGLEVGWMQDPRYRGTIAGHFTVDGQGSDRATLVLHGGGRIAHAALALGTIDGADVRLDLDRGAMHTAFDGRFDRVDPAVAFGAAQVEGQVTGRADVRTSVRDIYADTIGLGDYDVDGTIDLQRSVLRRVRLDSAHVEGSLHDAVGRFPKLAVAGPVLTGQGSGTIAFDERHDSAFDYDIANADLAQIEPLAGRLSGRLAATGHVSGPFRALTVTGRATIGQLAAPTVSALEASGKYTLTVPSAALDRTTGRIDASASFLTVAGDSVQHAQATVTRGGDDLDFTLALQSEQGRHATAAGAVTLATADQRVAVHRLSIAFGRSPWTLAAAGAAPVVRWSRDGVSLDTMTFVSGAAANERIAVGGDWRRDGSGALHVALSRVYLDTLQGAFERPARYGGIVDAEATIRGTAADPSVSATFSVTDGRVRRVSYEKISGRVDYTSKQFTIDARLDQAPGVWLTAKGTVPRALFDRSLPEQPIDLSVVSSAINLGLLDGLTDVVSRSRGTIRFDVRAIGTSRDPHFQGFIEGDNVGFLVAATGSTYKNGHAAFRFTRERVDVDAFHIEDANGRPLDLHGSLATHELSVGNLEIDASCRNFEVIHNEFGRVQVAADLQLRGRLEAPRIAGDLTISSGDVRVDQILERAVFQPYHTEEAAAPVPEVDAVAALNPWDRLGLDISLHTPNTLKLSGENVQVSPGAPIGLGNIKLRAAGDLYLYKDPGSPLSVNGSLDSVSGTYGFQGRDFDVDPSSSITFTGDLDPELYVVVTRLILGVDTRVTISGPLRQPELRLSSNPPLDSSDILSLIVFNTSPNQLSATQQQELAVRAGALAAGFIATPVINALQNELGLDVLSVEPSGDLISTGPKVTVGEELAPGLVARFSRQFGSEPYDEATIEYYLSRILRLRATFSDAQSLEERSPFRRIERAGVDLLFFFSF
jgi:translocation and assembly module TamB